MAYNIHKKHKNIGNNTNTHKDIEVLLLKEIIIFFHAFAAVLGMGEVRPRDIMIYTVGHRVISASLALLVLSGLGFLMYYTAYAPETLGNEKIYGKSLMVFVLSMNGFLLKNKLLSILKSQIGKGIFEGVPFQQIRLSVYNGIFSFVLWGLIFVLGTFRTLNNVIAFDVYVLMTITILGFAFAIAHLLVRAELKKQKDANALQKNPYSA